MKTALLVIDMQKNVVAKAYQRDEVIANILNLVKKARMEKVPVIWIQHSNNGDMKINDEGWQYVTELQRLENEPLIHKIYGDSFEDTNLKAELDKFEIKSLVVTGAQTDACILSTIHGAFVRGYNTTLVSDAHTTEDLTEYGMPAPDKLISFANIYWGFHAGPGRKATVVKTNEVQF